MGSIKQNTSAIADLVVETEVPSTKLNSETKIKLQQRVNEIKVIHVNELHNFRVPKSFKPWTCELSPSALYSCSLKCRKAMGYQAPEVKWMSIKRWVTVMDCGIKLPEGVFYSIKRHEMFDTNLTPPKFKKTEFILLMFPYGNVWSQREPGLPITDDWLLQEINGKLILEHLFLKDAAKPAIGYFESVYDYYKKNPDQIGIHLKRKKSI